MFKLPKIFIGPVPGDTEMPAEALSLFAELIENPSTVISIELQRNQSSPVRYKGIPTDTGTVTELFIRYDPVTDQPYQIAERILDGDVAGSEDAPWVNVPAGYARGGYQVIACGLSDCSFDSIFANLDSGQILVSEPQHLPPLATITDVDNLNSQLITTRIEIESPLVEPEKIGVRIKKDGTDLPTTTDPWQFTTPVSTVDVDSATLYAPGTYWPAQVGLQGLIPSQFEPGNYSIEVSVNGIIEDKIEFTIGLR